MNIMKQSVLIGALLGAVILSAPATASPLSASARDGLLASSAASSEVIQVQARRRGGGGGNVNRGGGGGGGGRGDVGAGVAAGIIGLAIGAMIAGEAQRQQNVQYCASRYRSYDPQSGTYVGRNGVRYRCP